MQISFYYKSNCSEQMINEVMNEIREHSSYEPSVTNYSCGKAMYMSLKDISIKEFLIYLVKKYPEMSFSASDSFSCDDRDSSWWTTVSYEPIIDENGEVTIKEDESTGWH